MTQLNTANQTELTKSQQVEFYRQWEQLSFGVSEITPEEEFKSMLKKSIMTGIPLRIKCGIDPTITTVHLGHSIPYRKMRQFQDLGHTGIVVIGDYTAQIGDPSGKNETRQSLTSEVVKNNATTYIEQLYRVLDKSKTEIRFQSEWFSSVTLSDVIQWCMETTVAKLLSHDTFHQRLEKGFSLCLHELMYPILQGIDSVYIKSDIELGGTDQKFNVLMGRDYQKHRKMRQQVAILLPIITGTCGTQKMSKSLNNFIGILDTPFDQFGKVMSIPDVQMVEWSNYLTTWPIEQIKKFQADLASEILHPNDAKKQLASTIVSYFHGEIVGEEMRKQFEQVFAQKKAPTDVVELNIEVGAKLIDFLAKYKIIESNSEGRRLIQQGGVSWVEGEKILEDKYLLQESDRNNILKIGKKKFIKFI